MRSLISKVSVPLVLLALCLAPGAAQAWDAGGHMLVDEIAVRQLKPGVAAKIEALIPLIDPRFNNGHPYNLVTVGTWMDDLRGLGKDDPRAKWTQWHYIDLPCTQASPSPPPDSEENAYTALTRAIALLRAPGTPAQAQARAEAVAQVMHLVGDIHQPLHTATRDDRGGNGYLIVPPVPLPPNLHSAKPFTLHRFWDEAYRYAAPEGVVTQLWSVPSVAHRPSGPGAHGVIAEKTDALLAEIPAPPRTSTPPSSISDSVVWGWICESHLLACQHAWPPGPPPQSYEAARLTPDFVDISHKIADRQIVLAGYRLGALLNELFEN